MKLITYRAGLTRVRRYDEIRTVQVTHLVSVWLSGGEESEALHRNLDEKIDNYAAGKLGHAVEAVSSIWDLSRKKETLPSISRGIRGASHKTTGIPWGLFSPTRPKKGVMRASLVESIQRGPLLYRKYWARRSRGGTICPIYFPSALSGSTLSRVATCEWNAFHGFTSAELGSGRMLQG